jgi:hypothetical protein
VTTTLDALPHCQAVAPCQARNLAITLNWMLVGACQLCVILCYLNCWLPADALASAACGEEAHCEEARS